VFVGLTHHRRRVLHVNVTEHPTAAWAAQQVVEAFPDDPTPAYLLRDRDTIYGLSFRQRVKGMRILEVLTAAHRPWQTPFVERLIGSVRRECLCWGQMMSLLLAYSTRATRPSKWSFS
jgi:putative transposase